MKVKNVGRLMDFILGLICVVVGLFMLFFFPYDEPVGMLIGYVTGFIALAIGMGIIIFISIRGKRYG